MNQIGTKRLALYVPLWYNVAVGYKKCLICILWGAQNLTCNLIIAPNDTKCNQKGIKVVKFVDIAHFSCQDIANMTGKTLRTVHRWCRSGKLKASKPGGRDYLISRDSFEEFMNSNNGVKRKHDESA